MQKVLKVKALTCMALAIAIAGMSFGVNAQSTRAEERVEAGRERAIEKQTEATEKREAAQTKLTEQKLKVCEKREKAITNIMSRASDRGKKQLAVFTKISEGTQTLYRNKSRVLENYDALVAEVNAKHAEAMAEVTKTSDASAVFACNSGSPKEAVAGFRESLKAQNEALKAYRTAVKNLIVGVKSVQGSESSSNTQSSEGAQQ